MEIKVINNSDLTYEEANAKNYKKYVFLIILKLMMFIFFIILLLITKNNKISNIQNNTINIRNVSDLDISEIKSYKNQTLKLLVPSKQCNNLFPRTVYLTSNFRTTNISDNIEVNEINLKENDRRFFVTFYSEGREKHLDYFNLLEENGLIRGFSISGSHNIFTNIRRRGDFITMFKNKLINKYQKKYGFSNVKEFYHKNLLYKNYKLIKNIFNNDFNYMSETYSYPEDKTEIKNKFNNYKLNLENLWLVKPTSKSEGRGISIFKSLKEISLSEFLITKFIKNPDLIDKKKYDLRLYVLVTGLKPLRIYLNKEGLVRRSSEIYNISLESIENKYIFLTNTGFNIKNEKYNFPKNYEDKSANIWNLFTYKKYLKSKDIDYNIINEKIKDIIIKSIISFQKKLLYENEELKINDRNIYSLFGFDILITNKYEPILLEINNKPNLTIKNIIDKKIKLNLFVDMLNLVGIVPFSHDKELNLIDKELFFNSNNEELINNAFCELTRPRGDLELIFPLKENIEKYKKYFIKNNEENIKFWEKIKSS